MIGDHMTRTTVIVLISLIVYPVLGCGSWAEESDSEGTYVQEAGVSMDSTDSGLEKAVFGAGCFWGVEASFRKVPGVVSTQVGYTGGKTKDPTYRQVCGDRTGHAEVVEVNYDPAKVSYVELLEVFFSIHDPTQYNRQGLDVGSQYRSAIFYLNDYQAKAAEEYKEDLEKSDRFRRAIATEIAPADEFYRAEEYHQQYYEKRGISSCPTG